MLKSLRKQKRNALSFVHTRFYEKCHELSFAFKHTTFKSHYYIFLETLIFVLNNEVAT